jgi:hypothetical protein
MLTPEFTPEEYRNQAIQCCKYCRYEKEQMFTVKPVISGKYPCVPYQKKRYHNIRNRDQCHYKPVEFRESPGAVGIICISQSPCPINEKEKI